MNQKFFHWKPLILSGAFLTALTACSSGEGALDLLPETDAVEIRLSGDIGSLAASADTRGAIDANYNSKLSVRFARIDQTVNGLYSDYDAAKTLSSERVGGTSTQAIEFTTSQYYLTRETNNNTKLVGWHPVGSYVSGKVTFDISEGTTDVMLTQELIGNKKPAEQFGATGKSFLLKHLLTKVTVKAYGDAVAKDTWGVIKSVNLKGKPKNCVVTLPGTVGWLGAADIALKNSANDAAMTTVSLDKTSISSTVDCGYVMFAPTTSNTLLLEVVTEKGGTRNVTASLAAGSTFAAGKAYTITLQFKSTAIEPTATISAWTSGGNTNVDL